MTVAAFGIAFVGLLVSIITLMIGNEDRKFLRLWLGGGLLLVSLIFVLIGVISFMSPESRTSETTQLEQDINERQNQSVINAGSGVFVQAMYSDGMKPVSNLE